MDLDNDTDEKSSDAKFRAASRSWRQIFHMPENERLVNCKYTSMGAFKNSKLKFFVCCSSLFLRVS